MQVFCRSMTMICTALGLLVLAGTTGLAQETMSRRGDLSFSIGWQETDLAELNQRLADRSLPSFEEEFLTLGGTAQAWLGRWVLAFEGHGLLEHEESTAAFDRSLTGGYFFVDGGYRIPVWDLQISPAIGIGTGSFRFKTVDRTAPTFDEVLDEPGRVSELSQWQFLFQGALGLSYPIELSRTEESAHGISLGLKAGYIGTFARLDWRLEGEDVSGSPDIDIEGGYIRFAIGYWRGKLGE